MLDDQPISDPEPMRLLHGALTTGGGKHVSDTSVGRVVDHKRSVLPGMHGDACRHPISVHHEFMELEANIGQRDDGATVSWL